jgi:hypothetical protein
MRADFETTFATTKETTYYTSGAEGSAAIRNAAILNAGRGN